MTLEEAKKDMLKFVQLKTSMALRPAFLDPLLNAVEERHAHWEQYSVYGDINFRCSACKKAKFHNGEMIQKYRYCYNCGAKMDEEAET